ncbi:hypothetical protein C9374_012976 [Naegleria lovaniensis]|uniref:Uncharacterized protein n=1 Tax=Naegleria lovaniensis TaxID=51637 RepID=A0AA88GF78_NAELO|nr:uncharacterized protein C9374_012976 [Naegleria lovaniensis]KAG2372946.1 hypothetical protein C9374_012976 [Naegleria lovaniensis]
MQVLLQLVDFIHHQNQQYENVEKDVTSFREATSSSPSEHYIFTLMEWLKCKFNNQQFKTFIPKAFNYSSFQNEGILLFEEHEEPLCIALSYRRWNCLFVSCYLNNNIDNHDEELDVIYAYDLDVLDHHFEHHSESLPTQSTHSRIIEKCLPSKFQIQLPKYPSRFCLNETEEFIIAVCSEYLLCKIHIETRTIVWQVDFTSTYNVSVIVHVCMDMGNTFSPTFMNSRMSRTNSIYVTGRNEMFEVDFENGSVKRTIDFAYGAGSTFDLNGNLLVPKTFEHAIVTLDITTNEIIQHISGIHELCLPTHLCIDVVNGNIIASVPGWHGIVVLSSSISLENPNQLLAFKGDLNGYYTRNRLEGFYEPNSLCLNAKNGKLFIVDYGNYCVKIFK